MCFLQHPIPFDLLLAYLSFAVGFFAVSSPAVASSLRSASEICRQLLIHRFFFFQAVLEEPPSFGLS
jgi:hypothetical protein